MAVIAAVVTVDARKYWPQMVGGLVSFKTLVSFKVGEGGWVDPGAGREPRVPDPELRRLDNSLQDLDCIVDPTRALIDQRYASDERASFEKTLVPADITFIAPSTLRVRCLLDFGDFNDDGFGNDPEIWEIGVFSDHPTVSGEKLMVAYGTFPQQTKDGTKQIENIVRLVF